EERRKDYYEMFFHHILTNTLLILSYATNFVRIGNAMLCIMDFADIFLTSAKSLRYLRLQKTCDVMFGLFVIVWFITRHGLFFCIWYSVAIEPEQYGSVNWDPANGIYYTPAMRWVFNGLFALLQVVLLIWTSLIIKVLVKVLRGKEATDNRSDSSSSDEHEPSKKSQ
ncbi:Sphingosine N-acyltransferase lag1, partial [Dimargaris verticillata]